MITQKDRCEYCGAVRCPDVDCDCDDWALEDLDLCNKCGKKDWTDIIGDECLCDECTYEYWHHCDGCATTHDVVVQNGLTNGGDPWIMCIQCYLKEILADLLPIGNVKAGNRYECGDYALDIIGKLESTITKMEKTGK